MSLDIDSIDREFVAKGDTLDGGWDWASDHGPDLIMEVRRLQEIEDNLRGQLKDAFAAGCCAVLTWTHSGMPQDDLDEAGYDYAASVMKP